MRTKNAKRLWPVPATLTVVALAAFLAFGLMATTDAQPAAAQDDPDCTIGASISGANISLVPLDETCNVSDSVGPPSSLMDCPRATMKKSSTTCTGQMLAMAGSRLR